MSKTRTAMLIKLKINRTGGPASIEYMKNKRPVKRRNDENIAPPSKVKKTI